MREIERIWEMGVASMFRGNKKYLSIQEREQLLNNVRSDEENKRKKKEEELVRKSSEVLKMKERYDNLRGDFVALKNVYRDLMADNERLKSSLAEKEKEHEKLKEIQDKKRSNIIVREVSRKDEVKDLLIHDLKEEIRDKTDKISEYEQLVTFLKSEVENRDELLAQHRSHCENCENKDLCLKRVLLVGGIAKLKDEYEKAVLSFNGQFKFHEGHKSKNRELKESVKWADTVLMPVEVNSHFACLEVKKLCKKWNKQYHVINSASVSSVRRSLESIA